MEYIAYLQSKVASKTKKPYPGLISPYFVLVH